MPAQISQVINGCPRRSSKARGLVMTEDENPCGASQTCRTTDVWALADEVFAPRQQREQLEPEIGNNESSECDRWNAHERIPDYGCHAGMNGVEYDDVRQVHAIAHAREIVYQSP